MRAGLHIRPRRAHNSKVGISADDEWKRKMAKQISKVVSGVLTARADAEPGVQFVGPDGAVLGALNVSQLSDDVKTRLIVHAISQKVGDSYAGAGDADDPVAFSKSAISETIAQLLAGEWRVSAGAAGPRATLLARALARVTGKTVEEAMSVLENLDDAGDAGKAKVKAIRAMDAVKAATAAIKLEDQKAAQAKLEAQAAKGGNADSLAALFTAEGLTS